nr:MAG TPA: hypothetical protein [Caudoviricetes sp.]
MCYRCDSDHHSIRFIEIIIKFVFFMPILCVYINSGRGYRDVSFHSQYLH